jgi:hypothetical protein
MNEGSKCYQALTPGATYIKLGQFIASSPTLFPAEYVQEFQKCFDKTPPVPFAVIRDIIAADLGKPVDAARGLLRTSTPPLLSLLALSSYPSWISSSSLSSSSFSSSYFSSSSYSTSSSSSSSSRV